MANKTDLKTGGIPTLTLDQINRNPLWDKVLGFTPKTSLGTALRAIFHKLSLEEAAYIIDIIKRTTIVESELRGAVTTIRGGMVVVEDLGVLSRHVVTDTGVGFIVDAFQNLVELENMKYHGFGSGTTAEAANQTALVTEFTTEYATDNTRPTGTTTENAANIYETVATFSPDANVAVTEHGVFSQAATGGGVMIDRSKFNAINLTGSQDSLTATYRLTFSSGG